MTTDFDKEQFSIKDLMDKIGIDLTELQKVKVWKKSK